MCDDFDAEKALLSRHLQDHYSYVLYIHTYIHSYVLYIHTYIHSYVLYIHTYIHVYKHMYMCNNMYDVRTYKHISIHTYIYLKYNDFDAWTMRCFRAISKITIHILYIYIIHIYIIYIHTYIHTSRHNDAHIYIYIHIFDDPEARRRRCFAIHQRSRRNGCARRTYIRIYTYVYIHTYFTILRRAGGAAFAIHQR